MEDKSLYKRYRPKTLKGIVGQDGAVNSLQKMIDKGNIPHAILLTGPSGCGKTTIARILQGILNCGDKDFIEMNCADFKGIEMVRDIRRSANLCPLEGDCRIWLLDEAGKMTGEAQNAFLKLLEDTPKHVYFMLATTDPQKLIKTIHTRCSEIKLVSLSEASLQRVLQRVMEKEQMKISEDVITEIIEACDGSARKALVILEQVGSLDTEEDQIKAVQASTFNKDEAILLARALFNWQGTTWGEVAKILKNLKDQDVEGIRYLILGYARSCMLGKEGQAPNMKLAERAFKVIDIFSENFYDSKHAGLAAACWEVVCRS